MEGIPISTETLEQFRNENFDGYTTEPAAESVQLEQLNEAVGWLLKTADTSLAKYVEALGGDKKEVEKVQWSPEMRDQVSELSIIVAKRNLSPSFLEKTPEFFLASILIGKGVETSMVLNQIKKRNVQPEKKEENE